MAIRLRLLRTGKKKQPSYRIVAAESTSPRDGKFLEILGSYDPRLEPSKIVLKKERVQWWLSNGAQPSERVAKLLAIEGISGSFKTQKEESKS